MRPFLIAMLLPLAAFAVPQPPQLASLEHQLAVTQNQLKHLETRLAATRQSHQKAIGNLNTQTVAMLKMARWPWGVQALNSFTNDAPPIPGLMHATTTFTNQKLQTSQKQLTDYIALHQGARATQAELSNLSAQLSTQRKRLTRQQTAALNEALLEADHLAAILQSTLGQPVQPADTAFPKTDPRKPNTVSPVPGQPTPSGDGLTYLPQPNQQVVATLAGRVAYSGPFRGFGGLVIIAGSNGLHAVYAGLGTLEVAVGQQVEAGHRLGQMPPDANPKLYVELRRHGKPLRQR